MATRAADDFDTIRAMMEALHAPAMCRIVPARTLTDCLKSSTRCTESCPDRDRWTGPDASNGESAYR